MALAFGTPRPDTARPPSPTAPVPPDLSTLRAPLEAGLEQLGLALAPSQVDQLLAYLALLAHWNTVHNLTAVRDPAQMVPRHLLDSLAVLPWVEGDTLCDLGSGAGLPGIPLAIAAPRLRVWLVEATGKKARFLELVARELGLARVQVIAERAESAKVPQRVATVTARALAALPEIARHAARWLAPGGKLLALKGPNYAEELAGLPAGWTIEATPRLTVPGLDADRVLVVVKRAGSAASSR